MYNQCMPVLTLPIVLKELQKIYHPPTCFLNAANPFELLVATILSARCTDAAVNKRSPALFAKYRGPKDFAKASMEDIKEDIRFCGPYKAPYLKKLSHMLLDHHGGDVPDTMEELIRLPGVGRKTAAVVLYAAFGNNEGIAVDTHVMRLSLRLGFTKKHVQEKIEQDLMQAVPRKEWGNANRYLISHGRAVCTARNRKCEQCVFQKTCPSSRVLGRPDLAADPKKKIL